MALAQAANLESSGGGATEIVLSDAEFSRICELVREHSGIALRDAKRQMVYGRLVRRLRALRLAELCRVCAAARARRACSSCRNSPTPSRPISPSFFRESHHFDYLAEQLLPEIVPAARARVGCASGRVPARPAKSPTASPWSAGEARSAVRHRCQDPGDRPRLERARHGAGRCLSGRAAAADGAVPGEGVLP